MFLSEILLRISIFGEHWILLWEIAISWLTSLSLSRFYIG